MVRRIINKNMEILSETKFYKIYKIDQNLVVEFISAAKTENELKDGTKKLFKDLEDIAVHEPGTFNGLIDFSKVKNDLWASPDISKEYGEFLKNIKINKVAVVFKDAISRGMALFVIKISGREDKIKIFKDRAEALDWLNN